MENNFLSKNKINNMVEANKDNNVTSQKNVSLINKARENFENENIKDTISPYYLKDDNNNGVQVEQKPKRVTNYNPLNSRAYKNQVLEKGVDPKNKDTYNYWKKNEKFLTQLGDTLGVDSKDRQKFLEGMNFEDPENKVIDGVNTSFNKQNVYNPISGEIMGSQEEPSKEAYAKFNMAKTFFSTPQSENNAVAQIARDPQVQNAITKIKQYNPSINNYNDLQKIARKMGYNIIPINGNNDSDTWKKNIITFLQYLQRYALR